MSVEPSAKLRELVAGFDEGMLVTVDAGGTLQGRPMRVAAHEEDSGTLTFATSDRTAKVAEIRAGGDACVTFQGRSRHVSLSGHCRIERDRARIAGLWNKGWELWFPDGPEQRDLCLIVFTPALGEYWDQSGAAGLRFLWKAATAFARDERPDVGDDPAEHAETTL